eukprot:100272-Prorocentrum_lima.AAC.1
MEQRAFIQDLTEQLAPAIVPLITPPGERVQSASSGHTGVREQSTYANTAYSTQPQGRSHSTKPRG